MPNSRDKSEADYILPDDQAELAAIQKRIGGSQSRSGVKDTTPRVVSSTYKLLEMSLLSACFAGILLVIFQQYRLGIFQQRLSAEESGSLTSVSLQTIKEDRETLLTSYNSLLKQSDLSLSTLNALKQEIAIAINSQELLTDSLTGLADSNNQSVNSLNQLSSLIAAERLSNRDRDIKRLSKQFATSENNREKADLELKVLQQKNLQIQTELDNLLSSEKADVKAIRKQQQLIASNYPPFDPTRKITQSGGSNSAKNLDIEQLQKFLKNKDMGVTKVDGFAGKETKLAIRKAANEFKVIENEIEIYIERSNYGKILEIFFERVGNDANQVE